MDCEICVPKPVKKVTYLDLESTSEEEFNDSFTNFLKISAKHGISNINQNLILEACLKRRATCGAEVRYS